MALHSDDAEKMIDEIKSGKPLAGFRGSAALDRNALVTVLMGVGQLENVL